MSERLRSVVEQLDVRPDDRVLEIGCGTESWRRTFASGSKRDISPRSTARRRWFKPRRNAAYVEAGRAEFLVSTLEDLDLGDRRFDKVFAVRVGHFHRDPERARGIVERWLASGGALFVFFDQPTAPGASRRPQPRSRRRA